MISTFIDRLIVEEMTEITWLGPYYVGTSAGGVN